MRRVFIEKLPNAGADTMKSAITYLITGDTNVSYLYRLECKVGLYDLWDEYAITTESDGTKLIVTLMRWDDEYTETKETYGTPLKSWTSNDNDLDEAVEEIVAICLEDEKDKTE